MVIATVTQGVVQATTDTMKESATGEPQRRRKNHRAKGAKAVTNTLIKMEPLEFTGKNGVKTLPPSYT